MAGNPSLAHEEERDLKIVSKHISVFFLPLHSLLASNEAKEILGYEICISCSFVLKIRVT